MAARCPRHLHAPPIHMLVHVGARLCARAENILVPLALRRRDVTVPSLCRHCTGPPTHLDVTVPSLCRSPHPPFPLSWWWPVKQSPGRNGEKPAPKNGTNKSKSGATEEGSPVGASSAHARAAKKCKLGARASGVSNAEWRAIAHAEDAVGLRLVLLCSVL